MLIHTDPKKIQNALRDFTNATGINLQLLAEDFSHLFETPREHNSYCATIQQAPSGRFSCHCSDRALLERCRRSKQVEFHTCHAGLIDLAVPILQEERIIGYIILGQMKQSEDFSAVAEKLSALSLSLGQMREHYANLPLFDTEKIQSVANLAVMLAKYLLLEHMLRPGGHRGAEKAAAYIEAHLDEPLSVQTISDSVHISKSALYQYFRDCFDCTVSEYITARRVERAAQFLCFSDLTVEEISRRVGFSTATYFTVRFKAAKGTTPLRYRQLHRAE